LEDVIRGGFLGYLHISSSRILVNYLRVLDGPE
jgi:hypothetical protein